MPWVKAIFFNDILSGNFTLFTDKFYSEPFQILKTFGESRLLKICALVVTWMPSSIQSKNLRLGWALRLGTINNDSVGKITLLELVSSSINYLLN